MFSVVPNPSTFENRVSRAPHWESFPWEAASEELMQIEFDLDRLNRQEDALTVVKGCLATVIHFWDRLGDKERAELLSVALEKTDELVAMFAAEVAPLRI